MNVFDLDRAMIEEYAAFSRSFTKIRAQDIRDQIDAAYATRKYWPEPILQINPHYKRDKSVSDLVREGVLASELQCGLRRLGAADPPGPVDAYREGAQKLRRHDRHGLGQSRSASSCRSSTPCCGRARRTRGGAPAPSSSTR